MGYFNLKTSGTQYHFNLHAANHEIILSSERYAAKEGARVGIESCQANAALDERYEKQTATNGKFYFALKAANGEVIGTSQMYTTPSGRDHGIISCKENGPGAPLPNNA